MKLQLSTALAALGPLLLGSALSAQLSFDVIAPDQFDAQAGGALSLHVGLVVNTGTEPITFTEYRDASLFVKSSEALEWLEVRPSWAPFGSLVVQPGEAVGVGDPAYLALLQPGETFVSGAAFGAIYLRLQGQDGQSPALTGYFELGGQRVRFETNPTFKAGVSGVTPVTAKRWSSEAVDPSFWTETQGCDFPGSDLMSIKPLGQENPLGGTVGRYSNLPFVGNDRFTLELPNHISKSEAGAPWFLAASPAGTWAPVLGCNVMTNPLQLASGVATSFEFSSYLIVDTTSAPLPDNPALAGVEVDLQWILLTPNASNGLFAASDLHRMKMQM